MSKLPCVSSTGRISKQALPLKSKMIAKPKLLSQSHQALLQSDPEMSFSNRLHSKLPKKSFPNRPHQQRVSKLLQNRMTAKRRLLSQSLQALLQSDPEMSFSNRLHSKLPKKCFPNRPHQQRVSKLLQNRMTAKPKLLSQSHQALLQSDPEMSFSNRLHSNLLKKCFPNRPHQQRVSKPLQNRMTAKPKLLSQSLQALLQSDPEMSFSNRLHSKLLKKCFPNRPHQQRVSKLLQNRMTAKPKLLSQSHHALLQSDPEMSFSNRLHSNLLKKCFPNRPHQQRVSKPLQNRMTAKPKLLSQSLQALLQSDPEMSFSNRLHSKLLKKCFPNRPHQQRVSKLLQNRMTAKPKLLSQSHHALLQSDPEMSFSNRLHSNLLKKCFPNRPHQQRVSKPLQNRMTTKSHQALLQSYPKMSFSNRLHSNLPKKVFPKQTSPTESVQAPAE